MGLQEGVFHPGVELSQLIHVQEASTSQSLHEIDLFAFENILFQGFSTSVTFRANSVAPLVSLVIRNWFVQKSGVGGLPQNQDFASPWLLQTRISGWLNCSN